MGIEDQRPLAEETRAKLARVSTATLATQLFKRGLRQQFIVGVAPLGEVTARWVGEAFTMRFIPRREDLDTLESLHDDDNLQWLAVERIGAGQVMVVDSRNDITAASAGDMLITRAFKRGAVAFVTDGALRDGAILRELAIPAYARAVTATTRLTSFHVADLQVPIGCSGVAVFPGDVLVGDADGVIVIPRGLAEEIADPAVEQEEIEDYLHTRVHRGESLLGVYPVTDRSRRDYEQWKAAQ